MKSMRFVVIILVFLLVQVCTVYAEDTNINSRDGIIEVKLVDRFSKLNCIEPLMIRAVVFKVDRAKKIILARIVSETYRGRVMFIEGNILNIEKGYYIRGAFCKNKLFIIPKGVER